MEPDSISRFKAGDIAGSRTLDRLEKSRIGHDVTILRAHVGTLERERDDARAEVDRLWAALEAAQAEVEQLRDVNAVLNPKAKR